MYKAELFLHFADAKTGGKMKIIKNFLKGLTNKEKLLEAFNGTSRWIMSMTFMKITAIVVVNCFLLTGVYGQAVAMVIDNKKATAQFKQVFEDFNLPYSYGKITSANYAGSDKIVVNIQDLHSHPQVQKNINNIIDLFDSKYAVKTVYLEGAYGQVSTKWLASAKDEAVKNSVMNKMLEAGRLTGAEYYSASKNKTEIIKGLENKDEYFDNLKRFGYLIDNKESIEAFLNAIENTVKDLQTNYYNRQQKKIEELSLGYVSGNIDGNKYFALMKKHAEKLGVDINTYPNLSLYMQLLETQKKIDYQRTTQELQMFVLKLKEVLPYNAYKMLLDSTKNFSQMDKLYGYIIKLSRQYNLNLSVNFPALEKFFAYIELSQSVNPLDLITEEQEFKDEINDRFSANQSEAEVVFLSAFVKYYRDYLTGKITNQDYQYYKSNQERFKYLWTKYIDNKQISAMSRYEEVSDKFYQINLDRNKHFLSNMSEVLDSQKISQNIKGATELEKTMNSFADAKEVYITVTGGFHTQEVSKLLSQKGITNIIITPSVSGNTKIAEETYYKIAQEQSRISFQAISPWILSQAEAIDPNTKIYIAGEIFNAGDIGNKNQKEVTELLLNFFEEKDISVEQLTKYGVTVNIQGIASARFTVQKDGTVKYEKLGISEGKEKSVKSIRQTIIASASAAFSFGWLAALSTIFIIPAIGLLGVFPVVLFYSAAAYFGLNTGFESYQMKKMNEQISEIKLTMSDEDQSSIIEKISAEYPELAERLKNKTLISQSLSEGTVAQASEEFVHLSYGMLLSKGIIDSDMNIVKKDALEVILRHELRHIAHPKMPEVFVGFGDLADLISITAGNIFNKIKSKSTLKKTADSLKKEISGFTDAQKEILNKVIKRFIPKYDMNSKMSVTQMLFRTYCDGRCFRFRNFGRKNIGYVFGNIKKNFNER